MMIAAFPSSSQNITSRTSKINNFSISATRQNFDILLSDSGSDSWNMSKRTSPKFFRRAVKNGQIFGLNEWYFWYNRCQWPSYLGHENLTRADSEGLVYSSCFFSCLASSYSRNCRLDGENWEFYYRGMAWWNFTELYDRSSLPKRKRFRYFS